MLLSILKSVSILQFSGSSEHAGVPFIKGGTEFPAMIPADPIALSTIFWQDHSQYLRALCA